MTDMIDSTVESFEIPAWARPKPNARSRRVSPEVSRRFIEHEVEYCPLTETFSDLQMKVWQAIPKCQQAFGEIGIEASTANKLASQVFDALSDSSEQIWEDLVQEARSESLKSDSDLIECIEIGNVKYYLRRPIRVTFGAVDNHKIEFSSELLPDIFVGQGSSIKGAREDFLIQIHREFQSLVKLRPHKRNEEQSRRWSSLAEFIDINRYWEDTPVALMEVGRIASINSDGASVAWLDGDRHETISWRLAPPEFAALRECDWFEALVERQATTGKLQAIRYVKPIEPLSVMSQEELAQWFASLPRAGQPSQSESLAHSG